MGNALSFLANVALGTVGFIVVFPIMAIINSLSIAHFAYHRVVDGNANLLKHSTTPSKPLGFSIWHFLIKQCGLMNAITIEEKLDVEKLRKAVERYLGANNFENVPILVKHTENINREQIYRAHTHIFSTHLMEIDIIVGSTKTMILGRFDFSQFDGTSCFNVLKGCVEAYYREEVLINRPQLTIDRSLVESIRMSEVIALGAKLTVAFSLLWGQRIWQRDTYGLFFPQSCARSEMHTDVLDKQTTTKMVEVMSVQKIKPFVSFMVSICNALKDYSEDTYVYMLTQISLQWRNYEPKLPRNQVGYWLTACAAKLNWADVSDVNYCQHFYNDVKDSCADCSGNVREGLLGIAIFGAGGMCLQGVAQKLIWFNNYGKRYIHVPEGTRIHYHWGPDKRFCVFGFFNIISLNGETCLTLGSNMLSHKQLLEANAKFFDSLTKTHIKSNTSYSRKSSIDLVDELKVFTGLKV